MLIFAGENNRTIFKIRVMDTVTVKMTERELKRFESFKEAEKIVRALKRSFREINEAKAGGKELKSARQLANEI